MMGVGSLNKSSSRWLACSVLLWEAACHVTTQQEGAHQKPSRGQPHALGLPEPEVNKPVFLVNYPVCGIQLHDKSRLKQLSH